MRHANVLVVASTALAIALVPGQLLAAWTPPPCTGVFTDVPCSSQFAAWVEQLFADGVTSGCAAGQYCPESTVTRRQMAVFLERAMRGTATWPPRLVRVSAVRASDGIIDEEASGQALLDALAAIPTTGNEVPAADNPWLVVVGPGVFELGGLGVVLAPHVHLAGSGRDVTLLRSSKNTGVVILSSFTSLRDMTVSNLGSPSGAKAISASVAVPAVIRDVKASAAGVGNSHGVYGDDSDVLVERCEISVGGAASNTGVYGTGTMTVRDSQVQVSGGSGAKTGVFQGHGSLTLDRTSITVDATATTSPGVGVEAVSVGADGDASLTELTASVSGATTTSNIGIRASGATVPHTVALHRSTIAATSITIKASSNYTVQVGASQLSGGPTVDNGGTVICFGVYDEAFTSPGLNTCP